ncbi:hypothetical protein SAMN02799631_02690 [Methylobacterium sp. 174MFSha1.1]|uniref:hypothetical protein n=1 Tax=Methylobacterium sp. 174MFSha1.1 TaxID=1502749 RepID=UPI0008E24D1B|nr:hypothetical protein [Methylobacterium sp. 174MFSha1.1]SFU85177.1 hypothetical protein SAMN02799631_02690 [Methylobacterium sp. 174MFSha1.1]
MALGGKARSKEQAAPLTPDTSVPHGSDRNATRAPGDAGHEAATGAQVRAHVRQVLKQAGSGASTEGN